MSWFVSTLNVTSLRGVLILLSLCYSFNVQSQNQGIQVRGGFFEDSLIVGDQIRYYLSATYNKDLTILFPDSTYNFEPFEFEHKQYFSTQTKNGISYDSVIYKLSTFEVDPVQYLSLNIFQVNERDCTRYVSTVDSIKLTSLVTINLDSIPVEKLPLKINDAYHYVSRFFNYPVAIIIISTLLVIAAVVWFVFGKQIRKHFKTKRLIKAHQKFIETYSQQLINLKNSFTVSEAEKTVLLWKKYMEQLEAKPYTKLTTRETQSIDNDVELIHNLKTIDGAVYGYVQDHTVVTSLEQLQTFSDNRFRHQLGKLKHG